jgi:hypothetical protein
MVKVKGTGFSYFLNGKKLNNFDDFEKAIKNIEVEIEIVGLDLKAQTKKEE